MKVHDHAQGSAEWHTARLGIPTASRFSALLVKKGKGPAGESLMRKAYVRELAGERLTGQRAEAFSTEHTERGHVMEPDARADYSFITDNDVEQVGFITLDDGSAGASPDGLIGADGMLEIKSKLPEKLIALHQAGEFPADHRAQTQGNLWIAEREWIDLYVYWPMVKPFYRRAYRDEAYIAELARQVALVNEEVAAVVEQMRRADEPLDLRAALAQSLSEAA